MIKKFLKSMFSSDNDISCKRVIGTIILISILLSTLVLEFNELDIKQNTFTLMLTLII
ncbi:MAG: hypothetical protein WC979_00800 [Candidatus Pacearchaeota archaeon]|jgi:hypothetical protein|nr:hypothetical protein [Clostridia bacterium]